MPTYTKADDRLELRLSSELGDELRSFAQREGESLSTVIRRAIRMLLAQEEHSRVREEPSP
jgi:metal-responsive CopG/Arc/MetJ family transcriptional regulator